MRILVLILKIKLGFRRLPEYCVILLKFLIKFTSFIIYYEPECCEAYIASKLPNFFERPHWTRVIWNGFPLF